MLLTKVDESLDKLAQSTPDVQGGIFDDEGGDSPQVIPFGANTEVLNELRAGTLLKLARDGYLDDSRTKKNSSSPAHASAGTTTKATSPKPRARSRSTRSGAGAGNTPRHPEGCGRHSGAIVLPPPQLSLYIRIGSKAPKS